MRKIIFISFVIGLIASCSTQKEPARSIEKFNQGWKFALVDDSTAMLPSFVDAQWRTLNLPHDWSVEGAFDKNNPATTGGGSLPGGIGWYRKSFTLSDADSLKKIFIHFDGVYRESEVYVNGTLVGKRPNGYISFEYDITPFVKFGNQTNLIAVKADNSKQPNSRWYSGSGIYRNVWLIKTNPVHVDVWGMNITTPNVDENSASVNIETSICNGNVQDENIEVIANIYDPVGKFVQSTSQSALIKKAEIKKITENFEVENPMLWCVEAPNLYKAEIVVKRDGETIDEYENTFGLRYFNFDSLKGFTLNGKPTKILGVCNHHDLGCLGAAINTRALERQLEILKAMGCNGIRTSHNPPAPELLDLCDKMGFIVMDEAFDMWAKKKSPYDYAQYWADWHVKDLTDQILRDRNHPSVFIWSIGNEITEQWDTTGITIGKELAGIVHHLDPYRPVTSALNDPQPSNNIYKSDSLDLVGFNYHHQAFEQFPVNFPGKCFIGTETVSSLNSRGCYDMPSDSIRRWPKRWDIPLLEGNTDNTCSSYDNCSAPWGSTHEETWKILKKFDFLSGMYIWTGFDYLGEPTPYEWPSRSSYFGIVDLAGFPKDVYYMYQSEWTNTPVLHIFPHWNPFNGTAGWKEGQKIDVWAYTNFDEVELFINGVSQGVKRKQGDDLHLVWPVIYQPGELKAVGKKANGETKEVIIKTSGAPAKLKLEADRSTIHADGEDLSFVTITVLDKDGNMVPLADNLIKFEVTGNASLVGVDNGCQTSMESFKGISHKAFNGLCLAVLQSKNVAGTAKLKAISDGLEPAEIDIVVK